MKKITPYTAAAVLILSRLYAYALYVPGQNESTVSTVISILIMNVIKILVLIPVVKLNSKKEHYEKPVSAFLGILSFVGLMSAGSGFIGLCRDVYYDRFSTLGIQLIWFAVCAYTASMGLPGISKASGFMVFAFTGVILLTFVGMRHYMLPDRMISGSGATLSVISQGAKKLCFTLYDIPILYSLLPRIKSDHKKSTALYITFDTVIAVIVFFMYSAVLGDFRSKPGYSIFTLFSCTEGTLVDRSDGVFIAITCACGMVTCAALMLSICDSIKAFYRKANYSTVLVAAAGITTVLLTGFKGLDGFYKYSFTAMTLLSVFIIFAAPFTGALLPERSET